MTVITDWLDVTYSPLDYPDRSVFEVLNASSFECVSNRDGSVCWRSPDGGVLRMDKATTHYRISASGGALASLRSAGTYHDYLSALSESPHTITRLDAAHDVLQDAATVIRSLRRRYSGGFSFSRKTLKTTVMLGARYCDGKQSGTWYAGHRAKAMVTCRVYDKRKQLYDVDGVDIGHHLTRYELTFRKGVGCSLRDAAEPERLFWHHASPKLLSAPDGLLGWSAGCLGGWVHVRPEVLPAALLKQRIQSSSELQSLFALAEQARCSDYLFALLRAEHERYTSKLSPGQIASTQ